APVPPETSDAYELGLKAELFGRRLRLGVTAFHTTYDDFQGQAFDAGMGAFVLTSAGSVITSGVELDFTAKPTGNLLLTGGIAYTDAYNDEFLNGPCWTGQTAAQGCVGGVQDLTDQDVPSSPDLKLTLQGRYDFPLDGPVGLYVSGAYRWQDDTNGSVSQRPSLDVDSYGIVDLSVGIEDVDGRWSATVFAKNLSDEFYTNRLIETTLDATDGTSHRLTRDYQRYVGVKVEYRFGGY
ncbi:MAG: TonB-dependent receptor, partial [Gammaproteobacteria bacterium]|nr:TonB-dependent receptor [Gammaproteobacteria bacterium]